MEGMNVSTVLRRLEAAASRLEDVVLFAEMRRAAATQDAANPDAAPSPNPDFLAKPHTDSVSSAVSPRSSKPFVAADAPPLPELASPEPRAVSEGEGALNALKNQQLAEFVRLSGAIAPGVAEQANAFASAFDEMLAVVAVSQKARKPDMDTFVKLLSKMNQSGAQVEEVRNVYFKERSIANFLATVPAGVGALGWVTIEGKNQAAPFVLEMRDSALFYANRVLKDDKSQKPWVDAFVGVLTELSNVIKQHFADGLAWNAQGKDALTVQAENEGSESASASTATDAVAATSSATGSGPAGGSGPAPPPPPPPSVAQLTANSAPLSVPAAPSSSTSTGPAEVGGMGGVLAELSQGETIATHLKPKTQALKASKPPISKSTKPKAKSAEQTDLATISAGTKPLSPRVELVESTWYVEDLRERHDVEIQASMGQSIQIDNCEHCTLKILGKAATFNMSRCDRVGLLVDTMVASCDIVNCTNFGLQVTGTLPSLMLDQSSQGQIYLSHQSLGLDIFTSQTNTININVPEQEEGAYREVALGEQIVHNLVNGSVKSSVVKHA